ncbi:MAG: permease-like cell division protein FtsX [Vulcanibacillus sp.]
MAMRKGRIRRHLKEGVKNIVRNGSMTLSAISAVAVTLVILGIVLVLAMNVNHLVDAIENQVEIIVELDSTVSDARINIIENEIKNIDGVKAINFVSKEEGLEELKTRLGDQAYLLVGLEDENPLYDMLIVQAFNPLDISLIANEISEIDDVISVDYGQGTVEKLFTITKWIRNIGIIFIVGLAFTAMFLISNTIKITINNRRKEIELMKLVGASNWFIRWPFFVEGLLLGVLGSIMPIILIILGYKFILDKLSSEFTLAFFELLPLYPLSLQVALLLIGIGAFIGIWGSLTSVRRFLKI